MAEERIALVVEEDFGEEDDEEDASDEMLSLTEKEEETEEMLFEKNWHISLFGEIIPVRLGVVYLDDSGDFVWPEESRPVATFTANKSRIHYTKPVNNQSVAVFIEEKSVEPKIYAQNFIDELLGVDEYDESSAIFVSNPVSDRLQIESELPLKSVRVYSLLGQQVAGENYLGSTKINIETENWKAGVYIVSIETESGSINEVRIIKE